jgi:hypothetical protein
MSERPTEDPLSMARRHVAEGRERVARQETLVSTIVSSSYGEVLARAQELLVTLQTSLALMERDLERLEKKRRHDPD